MTISKLLRPSSVAKIKRLAQGDAITSPTTQTELLTSKELGRSVETARVARRQELDNDGAAETTEREDGARVDEDQRTMSAAIANANLILAMLNVGQSAQSQTNGLLPPTLNLFPGALAGGIDASLRDLSHISSVEAMAQHARARFTRQPQDMERQSMLARHSLQQELSHPHGVGVLAARQLPILPPVKWPHGV
jgi:hypothetical protein